MNSSNRVLQNSQLNNKKSSLTKLISWNEIFKWELQHQCLTKTSNWTVGSIQVLTKFQVTIEFIRVLQKLKIERQHSSLSKLQIERQQLSLTKFWIELQQSIFTKTSEELQQPSLTNTSNWMTAMIAINQKFHSSLIKISNSMSKKESYK